MPIKVRCQCGKTLSAPDTAAGKAVKCPGCGKGLRIPGGARSTAAQPSAAARPAPIPPAASAANDLGDLFDEEGFSDRVESVCPSCRAEMAATAVLCTKCGYHKELGIKLESHKTAGVDIDHGTLALEKAAGDLIKDKQMQEKLLSGAGMPGWMLALVLIIGGGGLTIAVIGVNAANQEGEGEGPNMMAMMSLLTGTTLLLASAICCVIIVVHAFRQSLTKGLLSLLPPYILYHATTNFKAVGKTMIGALLFGIIGAGALFYGDRLRSAPPEKKGTPDNVTDLSEMKLGHWPVVRRFDPLA